MSIKDDGVAVVVLRAQANVVPFCLSDFGRSYALVLFLVNSGVACDLTKEENDWWNNHPFPGLFLFGVFQPSNPQENSASASQPRG